MNLEEFVNDTLTPAIYRTPARLFGGSWKRRTGKQVCAQHVITNGRDAHDGVGAIIFEDTPYLICDGADAQTNTEIVAWYAEVNSLHYYEAARAIADIYGITFNVDESTLTPYQRKAYGSGSRRDDLADVRAMAEATSNDCAEAVYLRARGITDAQRRAAYLFAVNDGTIRTLVGIHDRHHDEASPMPKGVNDGSHTVGIPVLQGGDLVAIYFRTIAAGVTPKYTSVKLSRASSLVYGLRRAAPTTQTGRPRTLIAVEGAFDAIAAQAAVGTDYDVVAYMTATIREEQARAIAKAGYRNIIQIADYDGDGKTADTVQYVRRTAKTLTGAGLTVLVADLIDEEHPDVKQDPNSFLQAFGTEEFVGRVKAATHATNYIINAIARHAADGSDEARVNARRDIVNALMESSADVINDILNRSDEPMARLFGDIEDLREKLTSERQRLIDEAAEKERRRAIVDKYTEVSEYARKGEYEEAKKRADEARRLIDGDGGTVWNTVKGGRAIAPIIERFKSKAEGLVTRWNVSPDGTTTSRTPIVIPPAAITTISARTGNGKTKALVNIALMFMERAKTTGRHVVYIPYEEDICDTLVNFINVDSDEPMQLPVEGRTEYDNKTIITTCIKEGRGMIKSATESKEHIFAAVEEGKLIIIDEAPTVEDIARLVVGSNGDIEALCIDYLQLIRTENKKATDPKNILVNVMQTLNHVARSTGVSVIAASQFNRECNAPTDMTESKNAAAADIEWATALNIGIYSSYRHPNSITWNDDSEEVKRIKAAGFNPDDINHHSIYMKVLKGRQRGQTEQWGVMGFDGNTGRIGTNVI